MIRLEGVTKSYRTKRGRKRILDNVSCTFPEKVSIGIVGRNGAGKSTLLRMLGGIEYPNRGRVHIEGSTSWPMALTSGFQPRLSGRENIAFVCRVYGVPRYEMKKVIASVEAFAEIGDYFEMPVKTYSSGMRSRLAFAMSLAFPFDYYLIDEITAVGDQRFIAKAHQAFEHMRDHAQVIMVSHNLDAMCAECDAGIYLHDGKIHVFEKILDACNAYRRDVGLPIVEPEIAEKRSKSLLDRRKKAVEAISCV